MAKHQAIVHASSGAEAGGVWCERRVEKGEGRSGNWSPGGNVTCQACLVAGAKAACKEPILRLAELGWPYTP